MNGTIELLDKIEELLKETLGDTKAREFKTILAKLYEASLKETEEREILILEEKLREKLKNELASKGDFYEFKAEIEKFRAEIKEEMEQLKVELEKTKSELLKWIIGLFLAQTTFITGLVLAIIKLFAKD